MPKFHFEIVDGFTLEDPKGMELPTEQHKQIASDVEEESRVVVKTQTGKVVHKSAIKHDSRA